MLSHDSFAPTSNCGRSLILVCGFLLLGLSSSELRASISYVTVASSYSQDFNSLPTTPTNTNLQSTIPWKDDDTSSATQTSIPGWYLYHNTTQAEGGTNGHQRLRIGTGNSTTGSFWDFGVAGVNAVTERALGNLTSSTIGDSFYGLRLTNNTGVTLGQFTLQYTGEQWRDAGNASPNNVAQTVAFGYAVTDSTPTDIGNFNATTNSGGITGVTSAATLNFTSPKFNTTAATLDGNDAANRTVISASVGGFNWLPGQDLWLRWSDPDNANADHGLAIDDLTFSADVPAEVFSVASGLASSGSTWSDSQPAGAGKGYHVVSGHVVTMDGAFLGSILSVENGSVDIDAGGNGQFFQAMTIEPGGNLTESVTGNVSIGNDATSGLKLNRNVAFNLDASSNFRLKAALTGSGNLDLNEASPGSAANAQVFLDATNAHTGIIKFNAGKQVNVTESASVATLEMNSTESGGNILWWEPKVALTGAKITFNQPGTLVHAVSLTTGTVGIRLQQLSTLVVNAPLTVDLSLPFAKEERRLLTSGFQGSGDITVKGTATDPTDPTIGGTSPNFTGVTLNEFEVGAQGTDPAAGSNETYSGTLTANDYVNVEIRRNLPNAKIIVNQNARLETGAQPVPLAVGAGTSIGEVVVASGGTLEVGFEQANAVGGVFTEGHHANHLILTTVAGRNGSLTLTGGATPSTLRMQINSTDPSQFDYINAHGNVALAGTLDVLVNPVSCTGNDPCGTNANSTYSPVENDTFDIISITAAPVQGDYSGNGSVGDEDYIDWLSTFGNFVTIGTGADGNRNGVIDAGDYAIWRKKFGAISAVTGSISGTFDTLNIVDPGGYFASAGMTLQAIYTSTLVQLKVVAASGSGASLSAAVPEPSSFALCGLLITWVAVRRRTRNRRQI